MQPRQILDFFPKDETEYRVRGHLPALDGVRGLAVLMVLFSHFLLPEFMPEAPWARLVGGGWLGVDLFFVLSGFLITGILVDSREKPNYWSNFYRRRILRIFPLYYVCVIIVWVTVVFIEKAPDRLHNYDSMGWFLAFMPNVAMALKTTWIYQSDYFGLNHLWSLAVEEQFYMVWPLVVWLVPPRYLAVLCVLVVHFSTSFRHWTDDAFHQTWSMASYVLPYCRLDGLAAGAFLAIFFRLGWARFVPYHRWLVRILILWMGWRMADALLYGNTHYLGTMSALAFAGVLYLALNPHPQGLVRRICENPFLCHIGTYSYGLYIFHHMLWLVWLKLFGNFLINSGLHPFIGQTIYILLAFAGTYILARLSWVLVEKPFLRLKDVWAKPSS